MWDYISEHGLHEQALKHLFAHDSAGFRTTGTFKTTPLWNRLTARKEALNGILPGEDVDGSDPETATTLRRFNSLAPETFPPLTDRHLESGHWWFTYHGEDPVAFAGMCDMEPFHKVCYLKRCYVLPDHVGHGLQLRLMFVREVKAREIGYKQIVSECSEDSHSNLNFRRAGFEQVVPEQPWGKPGSVYWAKTL